MSADASEGGCEWYFGVPFPSKRAQATAPATQERELKVGDRVKTNGNYSFDPTTGVVVECDDNSVDVLLDKFPYENDYDEVTRKWGYDYSELTLLPPTFPSGTRVRLIRNTQRYAVGDTGTVTLSSDESVGVRMDDGRYWSFKPEDLAAHDAVAPDCAGRNGEQACWPAKQEAKPKFKAGDVVRSKRYGGDGNTIASIKTHYSSGEPIECIAYNYTDGTGWDFEESIELVTPAPCPQDNERASGAKALTLKLDLDTSEFTKKLDAALGAIRPCIVIRQVDGQPRPSSWPHVHQSAADATKEAERLASVNPGKQFDVYQRVTGRVAEQHIEMKVA